MYNHSQLINHEVGEDAMDNLFSGMITCSNVQTTSDV